MNIKSALSLVVGVAVFLPVIVSADPELYKIDPVHSSVEFKIRHFFSKVTGQFDQFEGSITFDRKNVKQSKAGATIQIASINTKNQKRDGHLRSADFFDAQNHPTMTFKSTDWKEVGGDTYEVTGDLTMHGVTKPVTLQVKFLGSGPDASGGQRSGWEATTRLDRTAFGVAWNKTLEGGGSLLGNEVEITLNIEAVRQ